jgi:predicted nucleic acid-binding protein
VTYVVDASVAVKWFVRENLHEQALALLDHGAPLAAPDLVVTEVTNIAWKKVVRNEISRRQAHVITIAISRYIPALHPSVDLAERALEIALTLNHPVYDCIYLACAETIDGILMTADRRLHRSVHGSEFESLIRYLDDAG